MQAFDVLGDPVRRRILEILSTRQYASGDIVDIVNGEFGISQSAVSQHLKVLRDNGFAVVEAEGTRRLYTLDAKPLAEVDEWLSKFRGFWAPKLDALATEVARGKKRAKAKADSS